MVGIKGTGMSALALALYAMGIKVTGSDASDSFFLLDPLNYGRAGIKIAPFFDAKNIPEDADAIIVSTSHRTKNPEINKARKLKIPILTYPEIISMLSKEMKSVAICGSHGKTTTTNMLAYVLQKAHLPILPIAGPTSQQVLDQLPQPPLIDKRGTKGALFVFEADEYQNKLKQYSPFGVILTNIELDHPDYFKTDAQYEKVFEQFVKRIPQEGFLVYCADDAVVKKIAAKAICRKFSYGLSEDADFVIRPVTTPSAGSPFAIHHRSAILGVFRTTLMGKHNVLNAAAVVIAAYELGVSTEKIQNALMSFQGSPRRMEIVSRDPLIIDDYGHHPTEIRATLQAIRSTYPDRTIWTVFHPHTFTRTKKFLKEFGDSFGESDHTIVLEIWGSARETQGTVSSKDVVAEIKKNKGKAEYAATFEDAARLLKGKLDDDSLLLTIGAGDVWKLHKML